MYLVYSYDYVSVITLLVYTSCVICIWCLARSLDLTHDPAGDAIYEAPVVGDYEWWPADQVVEP